MLKLVVINFLLWSVQPGGFAKTVEDENKFDYWRVQGRSTLQASLNMKHINNVAKNVIMFLGDGMGIPTVTAIRIYKGQKAGKRGEEEELAFDKFPYVSLSKTYALDRQNPDSANTATAYLCGVKANFATLGVDGRVIFNECDTSLDTNSHVSSILQWAQEAGKSTGFVTSTRVTHATPAGLYAHSASRDWEDSVPDSRCTDIATQLIHHSPGKNINVILGGGRSKFLPKSQVDDDGVPGSRNDTRDLLKEWLKEKQAQGLKAKSVFSAEEFSKLKPSEVDYLLGIFHADHLPYVADRPDITKKPPDLVQLTQMAIRILSKNRKGFFLLVEGGKIDIAHHDNYAMRALEEGVEFDRAIQAAVDMTDVKDTQIVVTADHSHTFTIGGDYPDRGNNIIGIGGVSDVNNFTITTLTYANGPGYKEKLTNLTESEVTKKDYQQHVAYPLSSETHGAEDVAVYARGPMAHLFHGVHEQSYIPYVMGYAACIGPSKDFCTQNSASSAFSVKCTTIIYLYFSVFLLRYIINLN